MDQPRDGLPVPRLYWAVFAISLGVALSVLDGVIAIVALPTIAHEMNASTAASIWVINAYQLAVIISLLPLASLGDIIGYRHVFQAGLLVFAVASVLCGLMTTLPLLGAMRALQGFGAAGIMAVGSALVRNAYPARRLGRGIGINAMVVSASAAAGPTIAGLILSIASWRWLFFINAPLCVIGLAVGVYALPRDAGTGRRFDWPSAVLNALTFGLFFIGVDAVAHHEDTALAVAAIILAVGVGVVFVRRQSAQAAPLLPVDLLRIPIFALSIGTSTVAFIAQMLAFVCLPFYFRDRFGLSPSLSGLLLAPWPLAVGVMAPLAGTLADRYKAGLLGGIGLAVAACGLVLLAVLPAHAGLIAIGWRVMLCGIGFSLFQTPNMRTIVAATPKSRSGGAGGMISSARLVGQTTGAALAALIFSLHGAGGETIALPLAAAMAIFAACVSFLRLAVAPVRASAITGN